jgi:hypothetical protein
MKLYLFIYLEVFDAIKHFPPFALHFKAKLLLYVSQKSLYGYNTLYKSIEDLFSTWKEKEWSLY